MVMAYFQGTVGYTKIFERKKDVAIEGSISSARSYSIRCCDFCVLITLPNRLRITSGGDSPALQ
jgi:hypothetical protein